MNRGSNHRSELVDIIQARFLNQDGAGIVLERISQSKLVRLHHWFVHEDGGMGGARLLNTAPIFDTFIGVQAALPPFFLPAVVDGSAGGDAGDAPDALKPEGPTAQSSESSETDEAAGLMDDFESATLQFRQRGMEHDSSDEFSRSQMTAYGYFGCGLIWGTGYLESVAGLGSSPYPLEGDMIDFISWVSMQDSGFLPPGAGQAEVEIGMSPAFLTQSLAGLLPALDLTILSGYRLCRTCRAGRRNPEVPVDGHLRYLFFLGLVASGFRTPCYLNGQFVDSDQEAFPVMEL